MKNIYSVLLCVVMFSLACLADPPTPVWSRIYGIHGSQQAFAMCRAADGSLIVAGSATPSSAQGRQVLIMKLTEDGDTVWTLSCATTTIYDSVVARSVIQTFDGNFVASGSYGQYSVHYPFLFKFSASGDSLWFYRYNSFTYVEGRAVAQAHDTALVMAGPSGTASTGRTFVLRTSRYGGQRWNHTYGPTFGLSYGLGVAATPDNGTIIAGRLDGAHSGAAILRLNFRGDSLSSQIYAPDSTLEASAIYPAADSGYVLAGSWNSGASQDAYAFRIDTAGNLRWQRHWGGNQEDGSSAIVQLANGNCIVAGWTRSSGHGGSDGMVSQLNRNGIVDWSLAMGGAGDDALTSVVPSSDGGFYVAGYRADTTDGTTHITVSRFPPNSGITGTVRDSVTHLPVPNVLIGVLGQPNSSYSAPDGRYALYVVPGTYDFVISGTCVSRDTLRNVVVLADSMRPMDWNARLPHARVMETSITPIVHNHIPASVPLYVHNDGPGVLDCSIRTAMQYPHDAWFSVAPLSGSIPAGDSLLTTVSIQADTSNSGIYDYLGFIYITVNSCPDTGLCVAVSPVILHAGDFISHPSAFSLSCFPNPFNPQTTITLALPRSTRLSLKLYDVQGREVRTLCDGLMQAGVQHITVNGSTLPSGVYFARLITPNITRAQKLLLLK